MDCFLSCFYARQSTILSQHLIFEEGIRCCLDMQAKASGTCSPTTCKASLRRGAKDANDRVGRPDSLLIGLRPDKYEAISLLFSYVTLETRFLSCNSHKCL